MRCLLALVEPPVSITYNPIPELWHHLSYARAVCNFNRRPNLPHPQEICGPNHQFPSHHGVALTINTVRLGPMGGNVVALSAVKPPNQVNLTVVHPSVQLGHLGEVFSFWKADNA